MGMDLIITFLLFVNGSFPVWCMQDRDMNVCFRTRNLQIFCRVCHESYRFPKYLGSIVVPICLHVRLSHCPCGGLPPSIFYQVMVVLK